MLQQQINRALNPPKLDAELRVAVPALFGTAGGLAIAHYSLTHLGVDQWRMEVPDDADVPAITAVVVAHDATILTAQQVDENADTTNLQSLRDQYTVLKNGLVTIRAHMATIQGTPNPTVANLASLLQVTSGVKQIASDVTTMTNGLDDLLDALATLVRSRT